MMSFGYDDDERSSERVGGSTPISIEVVGDPSPTAVTGGSEGGRGEVSVMSVLSSSVASSSSRSIRGTRTVAFQESPSGSPKVLHSPPVLSPRDGSKADYSGPPSGASTDRSHERSREGSKRRAPRPRSSVGATLKVTVAAAPVSFGRLGSRRNLSTSLETKPVAPIEAMRTRESPRGAAKPMDKESRYDPGTFEPPSFGGPDSTFMGGGGVSSGGSFPVGPSSARGPSTHSRSDSMSSKIRIASVSEQATPHIGDVKYRQPTARVPTGAPTTSRVDRPHVDDTLWRVSVVVYQHLCRWERANQGHEVSDATPPLRGRGGIATMSSMAEMPSDLQSSDDEEDEDVTRTFHEDLYATPQWRYKQIRLPRGMIGPTYIIERVQNDYSLPTVKEIHEFLKVLFDKAALSAECSIVCLVYIERLCCEGDVALLSVNWRPITLCAMLLASKVWQDLATWNVEFAEVYPQYSLAALNKLERAFLAQLQFNLYISGSVYAKYYFGLRSMVTSDAFRRRYLVALAAGADGKRIEQSSKELRSSLYSRSV